jgi:hypothetical protein
LVSGEIGPGGRFLALLRFLGYDDFLYISQQARKKLGLRQGRKERRLPQLLADANLKRFFRAIQDCGDVQHEILLKLPFYTAAVLGER